MRGWFAALTVAAAATPGVAAAQAVTHPAQAQCRVHIVDAPAEARAEIESWVRAEPRCERELEVHVVATDDGLFLSARDGDGRVRERNVPDAQAAAVLVVSWMADDSLGPDSPSPALRAVPAASASAASAPALTAPPQPIGSAAKPSAKAASPDARDDELPDELQAPGGTRARRRFGRWVAFGITAADHSHLGVRGELELFHTHHLSLGFAAGWRHVSDHGQVDGATDGDNDRAGVGQLRLLVGMQRPVGRLILGVHLGVGANIATGDSHNFDQMPTPGDMVPLAPMAPMAGPSEEPRRVVPAAELGLIGGVRLTDAWGLLGGPVLQMSPVRVEPQLSVFVGVVRRL